MRPELLRRIAMLTAGGIILSVAGCSGFRREQRAQWRNDAELACLKSGKVKETTYVKISKSIDGPGVCGANYPMKVAAVSSTVPAEVASNGNLILTSGNQMLTSITPTATLSCPMVSNVDEWLGGDVQNAAMTWFGQPVIELITFGTFACRPMNHQVGAKLSEHSFANAIDVKAFKLADGRTFSVAKGWNGAQDERGFLRETLAGACTYFTTVLGPGSNALHYDHFHLDMARHDSKGQKHICRPKVDMPAPPSSVPALDNRLSAENNAPIYKPATGQAYSAAPSGRPSPYSNPINQPMPPKARNAAASRNGAGDDPADQPEGIEAEDYASEKMFNGKYFDATGSISNPDDPPVVVQHPGPPKKAPARTLTRTMPPLINDPAAR